MNRLRASVIATIVCVVALVAVSPSQSAAPPPIPSTTIAAPVETTSTTTTTTMPIPPAARCSMWWSLAVDQGFTPEMLPTLDRVLYRESRCDPSQHNPTDPNGGSHGLAQVNGYWCLPSRWYPLGYLQTVGVLTTCVDLYEPAVNLRAALALVEYSRSVNLSDWSQWAWLDDAAQGG